MYLEVLFIFSDQASHLYGAPFLEHNSILYYFALFTERRQNLDFFKKKISLTDSRMQFMTAQQNGGLFPISKKPIKKFSTHGRVLFFLFSLLLLSTQGLVYVYYREMSLCDNPDDLFWLRKSMEGIQDVLDKWDWRGKEGEDDEEEDPVPWVQEGAAADGEKE